MRSFLDWLKESAANQKPILFVGDNSAIIPSDHESGIKVPDQQTIQRLKPMAHSVYFEGTGEGGGQQGAFESNWVKKHLNINPSKVSSYDQGKIYPKCAGGLGPSILLFSNLNVNSHLLQTGVSGDKNTVADVIRSLLQKGGPEGSVPANKIEEFINICRSELGDKIDLGAEQYQSVAKEAESKMWPGGDLPGNGPLGQLADRVEKERRSIIVKTAGRVPGLYFLGSGHLISMQQEHGLPSDSQQVPQQQVPQQQVPQQQVPQQQVPQQQVPQQ